MLHVKVDVWTFGSLCLLVLVVVCVNPTLARTESLAKMVCVATNAAYLYVYQDF